MTGFDTKLDGPFSRVDRRHTPRSMSSNTSSAPITMSAAVATKSSTAAPKAPRATKNAAAPVVAAPVVAAAAPVAAETKAPRGKKAAAVAAPPTVPAAAPVATADAAAPAVSEEDELTASLNKTVADLHDQLKSLREAVSTAAKTLSQVEAINKKVLKKAGGRRRKQKSTPAEGAKPCHFQVPGEVVPELLAFLGLPKNTLVSRTDVTQKVMAYCKEHNLMDGQKIKQDAALTKLLNLKEDDNLTILNLQKYLKHVHVKKVKA